MTYSQADRQGPSEPDATPLTQEYARQETNGMTPIAHQKHKDASTHDQKPSGRLEWTTFPSLTGLKQSKVKSEERLSVSVDSHIAWLDLQDALQRIGASPTAALQIVWAALLSVYTDTKNDIAFLTLLPLRAHFGLSNGTSALLQSADQPTRSCYPRDLRSSRIRDVLLDQSSSANHPDFLDVHSSRGFQDGVETQDATILDLSQLGNESVDVQDVRPSQLPHNHDGRVIIQAHINERNTLSLGASFTKETLSNDAAVVMLEQLAGALGSSIAEPDQLVEAALSGLAVPLLSVCNPDAQKLLSPEPLHSQFEAYARAQPDRIALDFRLDLKADDSPRNVKWTYAELNQKADTLASQLNQTFGWLANKVVPICIDRCPEIYVAVLGILKAGGGWCPIDPSFPPRRRHDLIVRTEAAMVLTTGTITDGIPNGITAFNICNLPPQKPYRTQSHEPSDLAYLIWTSGTTGDPKGVPISHEAAITSMTALQKGIPTDTKAHSIRCLQFSQFTFDVFVQDLFYTWGVGGTLISSDRATMLGSFAELTKATEATHAHLTPAFAASVSRRECPTLEVVTMIGEKLTQNVADDWGQNMRAFNTYGPAETTVVSTLRQFGSTEDIVQSANVGLPLPSVSVAVIRNAKPIVKGGIGELALGGPQLSKGYWRDEKRSAGRFVWNEALSQSLYMTGDIVRMLYDGTLEFVGRDDDLVKIQGIRIELSEIAFNLRDCHPDVRQADVQFIDRPDRPAKVLVAFLAAPRLGKGSFEPVIDDEACGLARTALLVAKAQLPDYMIPRVFIVLGDIPRTSSNKVDRVILRKAYASLDLKFWEDKLASNAGGASQAAEWTNEESTILDCIADFSGTSKSSIARSSSLSSIGVDSIGATRLVMTLNIKGYEVSIADILQCRVLQDLLQLTSNPKHSSSKQAFNIQAFRDTLTSNLAQDYAKLDGVAGPALPLQEALIGESIRNSQAYWATHLFQLESQIDLLRLSEAWRLVTERTDALRLAFLPAERLPLTTQLDAMFLQIINPEPHLDWTLLESTDQDFEEKARQRAQEIADQHQSSLYTSPPWAINIFSTGSRKLMMVSLHHSIRDEISLGYIMSDLAKAYTATEPLPHRNQLENALGLLLPPLDHGRDDETFWASTFSELDNVQEIQSWPKLITDTVTQPSGFRRKFWNMRRPYKELQSRATNIGASSVASLLRLTWGCILSEYFETSEVVFGETWSSRGEDASLSDVVGPLISVIPVPFRSKGSAREALKAQADFQSRARAHFGVHPKVIRKLLDRPEGQALYPAVFNFIPDSTENGANGSLDMWHEIDSAVRLSVEHPAALNASLTSEGTIQLELGMMAQIIDETHLDVLAQQIESLTEAILEYPDDPLSSVRSHMSPSLLSKASDSTIDSFNEAWNQSPTHWVDYYADSHPEWLAAEVFTTLQSNSSAAEQWTFKDLQQAYRHVIHIIQNSGCHNQMIAVCVERSLYFYAILLGILGSGNTYLPIVDDLPEERKIFLLQDSDSAILFLSKNFSTSFPEIPKRCKKIYDEDLSYLQGPICGLLPASPTDNAYLLYTSGSTGKPKGVLVGRGNMTTFMEAITKFMRDHVEGLEKLQGVGKYLGLASYAFDVHLAEIFLAWRNGLAAVTAPRTTLLDNLELALRKMHVTHASFVPSLIDNIGLEPSSVPHLRYISVGGEMISKRVIELWAGHPRVTLANAYGPTEVTIGCCFKKVEKDTNVRNIGRVLAHSTAHVLGSDGETPVLRGTVGELCMTGDLVANGYHNRPDAKGFVDNFHGEKMYRTGDRVRLMADDTFEFLGRADDQTKIRGQRLELGEVTEVVRSVANKILGIEDMDAAAIVSQHPSMGRPQLICFLASRHTVNGEVPTVKPFDSDQHGKDIRAGCQKLLPAFMVPDHLILITGIPTVTISRKVDMKRLKGLFSDLNLSALTSQTPVNGHKERSLNSEEKLVADAVAATLKATQIEMTPSTSVFELGIDSLSVISLAVKLQKLGFDCSVPSVFQRPSIEQLASCPRRQQNGVVPKSSADKLSKLQSDFLANATLGLSGVEVSAVRPCLPLQETLVASSSGGNGESLYINHVVLRLSQRVGMARLHEAWDETVADQDILKTFFQEYDNHMVQVVRKDASLSWKVLAGKSPVDLLNGEKKRVAKDIIDKIHNAPPLRLTLAEAQESGSDRLLMISIHHALYDKVSFTSILDEVFARYEKLPRRQRPSLTAIIDHVSSQNQENARSFWKTYLENHRITHFDIPFSNSDSLDAERTFVSNLTQVEAFASSINGTPASLIQAIFGITLAQELDRHDVVFGTIYSGRTLPIEDSHSIVLPCLTTVPQRLVIQKEHASVLDSILAAQTGFVNTLEYQHTALRDIHRWVQAERPLFDCLFSYVRKEGSPSWEHLWSELESSMPNEFPLAVEVEADRQNDNLVARCAYSSALGQDRISTLLERMDLLLLSLVSKEHILPQDLAITGVENHERFQSWDENAWTEEELRMREAVSEVTGLENAAIRRGASFFSLGIDSISAIRFAQALKSRGFIVSSAQVMRYPCIAQLAPQITNPQLVNGNHEVVQTDPQTTDFTPLSSDDSIIATYDCIPLQSSMLTQTLGSDGLLYVHNHVRHFGSGFDSERLQKALYQLMDKLDILRTTFHHTTARGTWSAAVHKKAEIQWKVWDGSIKAADLVQQLHGEFRFEQPEDFARPPWRIDLTADTIILSMHHSLYDGEALGLLFEDLAALYQANAIPDRPSFYEAAQEIQKDNTDREDFWLRSLVDYHGVPAKSTKFALQEGQHKMRISTSKALEGSKDLGVTLQSLALFTFGKLIVQSSGSRDVAFGHVIGGRNLSLEGIDRVVGPLFNTVPFRFALDKASASNLAVVKQIQDFTGKSQAFHHASLGKINQEWQKRNSIAIDKRKLFDAIFLFQRQGESQSHTSWTAVDLSEGATEATTEYSTNFEFQQKGDELVLAMSSRNIDDLTNWFETFERIFLDVIENPRRSALAFPENLAHLPLAHSKSREEKPVEVNSAKMGPEFRIIQEVLSKVSGLSIESISPEVSLFLIGLDSTSAIQVAAACRKQGVDVSVADVLQGQSAGGIYARVEKKANQGAYKIQNGNAVQLDGTSLVSGDTKSLALSTIGIADKTVESILPCLAGQLYHLTDWLKSGRSLREATFTFTSTQRLDISRLRRAWSGLVDRHPILRTVFVATSAEEAHQVVLKPSAVSSEIIDETIAPFTSENAVKERIKEATYHRFDMFTPPVRLIVCSDDRKDYLILKMHHVAYDAWTVHRFIEDLSILYQDADLPTIANTNDFVASTLRDLRSAEEQNFWAQSLQHCEPTLLKKQSRSGLDGPASFLARSAISGLAKLEEITRSHALSLPTLILVSFAQTLSHHANTANPTFGFYQTGRSSSYEGLAQLAFPCLNVTPLSITDAANRQTGDLIKSLQQHLAKRVDYEQSYLHDILRWISRPAAPLFNTYVNILFQQSSGTEKDALLQPWNPADLLDSALVPSLKAKTAVDALDTSFLAEDNLYFDIGRDDSTDQLVATVRCDRVVMDESQAKEFINGVLERVENNVKALSV